MTPIHHRSGKSKRKARSSSNAEVQALAYAEQELYFTRLQMAEFLGFLVNLGDVDETVQRVDGVLVIDAKAIYESMFGALGPLAVEGKTDSHCVKSTSPVTENHHKNGYVNNKNFIKTNEDINHDTKYTNKNDTNNHDARDLHE